MESIPAAGQILVKMLGGFSIRSNGKTIAEMTGRTKKVWMLIEYLLANRSNDIPQEKLIEAIWEDEELDSPFNVLKNLVYRARKQLAELDSTQDEKIEYIQFVGNTYRWNNSLPCEIDVEEFEKHAKNASNTQLPAEERIEEYSAAIHLYQGEYLPKSSCVNWVISKNTYYTSLYNSCVRNVCLLLLDQERYEDIILICEKSISIYLFDDEIHKLLLYAYAKAGKISKALAHYDHIVELFQRELNVNISDSFRDIHKELVKGNGEVETDINVIKENLKEEFNLAGAFYCDYDIFKNIYRLQARLMQRTGQAIHVALITLSNRSGNVPPEDVLKHVMPQLKDCIVNCLRKGDVVSQYSMAQFVVILPLTTMEGTKIVTHRISTRFNQIYKKGNLILTFRLHMIDPVV